MSRILIVFAVVAIAYKVLFSGSGGVGEGFPNRAISEATPVRNLPPAQRARVILFTATEWCPPCRQLDQSVISQPAWKEFAASEILFRMVNVPSDQSRVSEADRKLMSRYQIRSFPTMVVVDPSGKELARQSGAGAPVENYKAWIRKHAG
jgi:thiol-disulfide isomerase/thioredoxin